MKKIILFSFFWIVSFILWPIWIMPKNFSSRFLFFTVLIIYLAVNIFLLNLWIKRIKPKKQKFSLNLKDKNIIVLVSFYIIFIIINLYLITLPITISDETSYVSRGVALYKIIETISSKFSPPAIIAWFFLIVAITLFLLRNKLFKQQPISKRKKIIIISAIGTVILFFIYFIVLNSIVYNSAVLKDSGMVSSHLSDDTLSNMTSPFDILLRYVVREGPLNTIIETIMISLFGFQEWALRIHSLIFSLLAGFYIYRIVLLFRDKNTALLAALIFLFIPGFFYFTHLGYKEAGLMFFISALSFYLMRYSRNKNPNDLIIGSFFAGIGYLYKDPVLFFIPIFWVSWFIYFIINKGSINIYKFIKKSKEQLIFTWFSLVPIIPWLFATTLWRKLYVAVLNTSYFTPRSLLKYILISMPYDTGWIFYIIFFIAFLYGFYRILTKNELFLTVSIITFISINVIYSFGETAWGAFQRWYVPALFGVVILIAVFIGDLLLLIKKIRITCIFIVIIGILLVIQSVVLTLGNLKVQYLPFDETFNYLKENVPENKNILVTTGPNPYRFYIEKYKIRNQLDFTKWVLPSENQNMSNLYAYSMAQGIDYIIFPYPRLQQYYYVRTKNAPYLQMPNGTWLFDAVNPYMVLGMSKNQNNYFHLIKSFEFGSNKMLIFKVNKKIDS